MRLKYWEDVLHKLDDLPRAQLSPEEQINYDVYRPEIENFVADQKFRDYEMPANSDSAFWTDLGETARRPFKNLIDYKNWITQMRDVPRQLVLVEAVAVLVHRREERAQIGVEVIRGDPNVVDARARRERN